jgi:hypothetical protein
MSSGPIVWTRERHEEWANCGPIRATITRDEPDEKNMVTVKVRIGPAGAGSDDDTPAYLYFAAGGLTESLAALKRDLEQELLVRAQDSGDSR